MGFSIHVTSKNLADECRHVTDVHNAVGVHVGIGHIVGQGRAVQHLSDERRHVGDTHRAVKVHVTDLDITHGAAAVGKGDFLTAHLGQPGVLEDKSRRQGHILARKHAEGKQRSAGAAVRLQLQGVRHDTHGAVDQDAGGQRVVRRLAAGQCHRRQVQGQPFV